MKWTSIGAGLLAIAVVLGAFLAHGLKDQLSPYSIEVFQKANFYHFVHALGILLVVILARVGAIGEHMVNKLAMLFFAGIILFSGSLYALAITDIKIFGAITPLGGTSFIIAWSWLARTSAST